MEKETGNKLEGHGVNNNLIPGQGGGRPKGQRNYATIYKEALRKYAENHGATPDEIEDGLVEKALGFANKGHHKFYQDLQDRLHGKAKEVSYNINVDRDTLSEEQKEKLDNLLDNVE